MTTTTALRDGRLPPRAHATAPSPGPQAAHGRHRPGHAWLPLLIAMAWMLGTFGLFWTGALAEQVTSPARLCLFVFAVTGAFAAGYALRVRRRQTGATGAVSPPQDERRVRQLVVASALYHLALGAALLLEYGANGPGDILASLQDPAQAYANKFVVYQHQQDSGRVNPAIQALTLLGVLGAALIPLLVIHWRRLSGGLRLLGLAGMSVYALFFLYIGTLKGLGDFVVMIAAGLLVWGARDRDRARPRARRAIRRRSLAIVAVVAALFCAYMVKSQADRVDQFGTQDRVRPNATVERVVGPHLATGVAALVIYPTHGYLGLAHNLETPFVWSRGLGSTPVVASYAEQYLGVDTDRHPSYPVRTEARTGWPSGMYWSTIYPWLASDLTYPGTLLFMAFLGWLFAAMWLGAVRSRRILPTLLFVQLCLLVAYIPANNQLGLSRPTVIGLITLLAAMGWTALRRRVRAAW
ncbi:hypothetical protein V6U77_15565 [Micromonospora sp. CPCC 205546]|uniref:hypothetical protein n=1 Tax=Micromonospora sp. CPCC 205546 TaxID=3122397 RepID=UPI002FF26B50